MDRFGRITAGGIVALAAVVLLFIVLSMAVMPRYNVWQQGLEGKAALARAEQDRQIAIYEADAAAAAADRWAEAEVARARGVAEANRIIADGLGGPEGYLRYLYIEGLKDARSEGVQIIYVPTEAGLPILEAGRAAPSIN